MNVLLIKSVFIPSIEYIDINIGSIIAFESYFNSKHKIKHKIKLIGWMCANANDQFTQFIKTKNIEFEQLDSNKGKAYILNKMTSDISDDIDIVMYADHDISPIDNLLKSINLLKKNIGLVSFDQEPDNRHNPSIYSSSAKINKEYFFGSNSDVATGCFIMRSNDFKLLSSLDFNNIYGDEDIKIAKILDNHDLISVVSRYKVFHPFDIDTEYAKWKRNAVFNSVLKGKFIKLDYWTSV